MKRILILLCSVMILGCSNDFMGHKTKRYSNEFEGVRVSKHSQELEVVLSIEENSQDIRLKVLGKDIIPPDYRKSRDQALAKFQDKNGETYHLLAQVNDNQEMRISITMEHIPDFVPTGQLGEQVYKLKKSDYNSSLIATSSTKVKNKPTTDQLIK